MSQTSVGQRLRQAREARLLSLEQISRATHMRLGYLQALETGDFDKLPSKAQARGFLRAYADYLALDTEALLQELTSVAAPEPPPVAQDVQAPEQAEPGEESLPAQEVTEDDPAVVIFREIGLQLQRQRDLLGLSLEDVESHTHLRKHYLKILEEGRLDELPSPVQGKGMLNIYASFLGMKAEPLLLRFAEGLQSRLSERQRVRASANPPAAARPRPPEQHTPVAPSPLRQFMMGENVLAAGLTLVVLVFVIWAVISVLNAQSPGAATPTAPSIADVLLATATSTTTPTLQPVTPSAAGDSSAVATDVLVTAETPVLPTSQFRGVQIYISVYQRAWMRITVDGKVEFEGRILPGSAYSFAGKEQVELLTGNAAALQIFFNGEDQGVLGRFGQVLNRVYTPDGVIAPTPTLTATPTITPEPSATPQPTATQGAAPIIETSPALP